MIPFVVIINISLPFYKLAFRKRIILKPVNILKLMHRLQKQKPRIYKPFKRVSVNLLNSRWSGRGQ